MIGGLLKSASSTALFAALGLIALGSYAPAAKAADLGGDCCADLEERVAELEATTARKGNRRVSLTISGQVETAIMGWDNGIRSGTYVVDVPTVGGTYFQFTGSAKISPTLSAGFQIQVGLDFGARSHQVNERDDDGQAATTGGVSNGSGDTTMVMTLANWYLDDTRLGRVTVGRITTATGGVTGVDLAGTGVIANVNVGYWNRSFGATAKGPTGLTWNNLTGGNTVNGSTLSRINGVSYTSPTFGGFSVSGAAGEYSGDVWDVALRYAGEYSGFRVAAAVGYVHNASGLGDVTEPFASAAAFTEPNQWKGSASIMHVPTGLYVQGAFVDQDNDVSGLDNTKLYYLQGGISKNWFGIGNTAIYGEWTTVKNPFAALGTGSAFQSVGIVGNGTSSNIWGVGVVQHIDAAAMEVFLAYRNYQAGSAGDAAATILDTDVKDMSVVMGGARIRF
jgi:hypothetical protein